MLAILRSLLHPLPSRAVEPDKWIVDLVKHGREALQNLGIELGVLSSAEISSESRIIEIELSVSSGLT